MHTNGAVGGSHGYALLIAASSHSRNAPMAATDALPALAAVPPDMLLGTATASVVQLADPDDPHVVLSHLRTAAAHDGPLLLHVAGRVMLDSRQQLPHLALAKSTARTVRYSGLPWHWLLAELQHRPAGATTVLADLVADEQLWQRHAEHGLAAGPSTYGAVVRQQARRRGGPPAAPVYSQAVAALLREATDARGPSGGGRGDGDAHGAGTRGTDGRNTAAHGAGGSGVARPGDEQLHQQAVVRAGLADLAPDRVHLLGGTPPVPPAPSHPAPDPGAPASSEPPAPDPGAPAPPVPPMPAAPPPPVPAAPTSADGAGDRQAGGAPDGFAGLHGTIFAAADAGRHGEASAIAAAWEQTALRTGGPASPDAIHWVEVRAELARIARDPESSCRLWLHAASARLQNGQDPASGEVSGAVDRAHHCWHQVAGTGAVRELGEALVQLRERAPGARPGALQDVRERLAALYSPEAPMQQRPPHEEAAGS